MKICLYSPYIPKHFGGGEKYLLDVAEILSHKHQVSIAIPQAIFADLDIAKVKRSYQDFFEINLAKVELVASPIGTTASQTEKLRWTKQFEVFYYLTDGSLFFSLSGRNILHIQIPFTDQKSGLMNRLKLRNWVIKNTNSLFTKSVVEKAWHTKINYVHHPMIEMPWPAEAAPLLADKQPIILSVGRFFTQLHSKRQDILIEMFKTLNEQRPRLLKDWQLVLVGGIEDQAYVDRLHQQAQGLPIQFIHDADRAQLLKLYRQAPIYWHAAGYQVDEAVHPEKVEHFGISTVEAMASAAAPVVIGKGGQPEILGTELKAWSWQTPEQAIELTKKLLENETLRAQVQTQALKRAQVFNRSAFSQTLATMIGAEV